MIYQEEEEQEVHGSGPVTKSAPPPVVDNDSRQGDELEPHGTNHAID